MTFGKPSVLVVGLGYVGSLLATDLASRGHRVWGLRRTAPRPVPEVPLLLGDASDGPAIRDLLQHAGSPDQIVLSISPGARTAEAYEGSYLAATETLLAAAPRARFILVSSTAVYGQQGPDTITDDSPKSPTTDTAEVLSRAEDLALLAGQTVVRASGIYGPGRTRLLTQLCQGDLRGQDPKTFTNRIHREDLSGALAFLVERKELSGSFIASDPEPAELGTMMAWARREKGLPEAAPRALRTPLEPEARRKSRKILPTRLLSLGFSFRYPSFRDGYRELLSELTVPQT